MQNADGVKEMLEAFQSGGEPLIVTYVPRDPDTVLDRGFDQSKELAKRFAKKTGLPFPTLIKHRRGGRKQKELDGKTRFENAKIVYQPGNDSEKCENNNIILIDDVITTGATASACAISLKSLGAKSVVIIAFAKNESLSESYPLKKDMQ